jgi:RND family efflux transporter MFP subunit
MTAINNLWPLLLVVSATALQAQPPQTSALVPVVSRQSARMAELPGEFAPLLSVSLHAKVPGFVERVLVDRGSVVKEGQLVAELSAPEMTARIAEAESKLQAAQSELAQAEARLAAAQSTSENLKAAAATPGAVAGNELIVAEKETDAARALVNSRRQEIHAAQAVVDAQKQMEAYLRITAPFDGVVTERLVHPGALVGAGAGGDPVLLVIQQISALRLVVAVPEEYASGIVQGAKLAFTVLAWPERTYSGTVARISHALNAATRTMPVELDVLNRDGSLAPGMYPTVRWPVRRSGTTLFVLKTSVVDTSERTFVIRNRSGRAEWVDVRKGAGDGDLIEVMGDLKAGDMVVRRGTDEMRDGSVLAASR